MNNSQPKAHRISQENSAWNLVVPTLIVVIVVASIVVLGLLGESETERSVHAQQGTPPAAQPGPSTMGADESLGAPGS